MVSTGERIPTVSAPRQIELILDASGSMWRTIDGRPMMEIARDVLTGIIEELPDDLQVALRVYGHRMPSDRPNACRDSELVVPFAKIDRERLLERVGAVQAKGTTPIAYALRRVRADFGDAPGPKMVVLVTDGKEECGGSPSDAVSGLVDAGLDVRVNIVGFALAEEAVKREMERVADLAGGRFFDARDAAQLRRSIERALAVPFDVLDRAGAVVASGLVGRDPVELPDGIYRVIVQTTGEPIRTDVTIAADERTRIELKKEGQEVGVRVPGRGDS